MQVSDSAVTAEAYLSANGYVGYSVDHQASRYTTDEQGINGITLEQYAKLPAGAIVYGIYAIRLDTKHYVESSSTNGTATYFVTDGVLRVKYKILEKVTGGTASLASETYAYGNSPDLIAPMADSLGYSTGVLEKIEITAQTSTIKNENSPAAGTAVDQANLHALNAGTTFKVYWKYVPDENHYGDNRFAAKEFTVTKAKATHDPYVYTGTFSQVEYGDEAPPILCM